MNIRSKQLYNIDYMYNRIRQILLNIDKYKLK